MNLVIIDPKVEPACLGNAKSYDALTSECLDETRTVLSNAQNGLCAYCERKVSFIFIEHYVPRNQGAAFELNFQNFLGVCSGKIYSNRLSGSHTSICGDHKGNSLLIIDPRNAEHIAGIYYDSDGKIYSSTESHNKNLNEILNLNAQELVRARIKEFGRTMILLDKIAKKKNQGKKESFQKRIDIIKKLRVEYLGYHLFRLRKLEFRSNN